MSTPLNDMPEIRATFQTDATALLELASGQLASLNIPGSDLAVTPALRKTVHSLRGAAAMVGAQALTSLVDDYERLLEVAESFKLSARDRAVQAYAFLQKQLERFRQAVTATVNGQVSVAQDCYQAVHREALAIWGEYFYPQPSAANTPKEPKPILKTARHNGKAGVKDNDALAREFLSSLGMASKPAADPRTLQEQIDPEMLSYFVLETNESLSQMEGLLLAWEKSPDDDKVAHAVFRLTHTIKGAANSLGFTRIGRLLHELEDLLESHVVERVFTNLPELVEVIFGVSDTIKALVREAQTGKADERNASRAVQLTQRIQALAAVPPGLPRVAAPESFASAPQVIRPAQPAAPAAPAVQAPSRPEAMPVGQASSPSVEVPPAETLETVTGEAAVTLPEAIEAPEGKESLENQTIRVESERLDLLMNLVGELVISRSRLEKKLADISRLKEEMFFGKTRLLQAITDFQGRYEYSNPTAGRNGSPDLTGAAAPVLPAARPVPPGLPADETGAFSELEFDQYDDFNILARTLMEIGTDTGEIFSQLNRFFDAFDEETRQFSKITARLQDEITRVRMMPLTLLLQRLQRSARDASRKEEKDVEFVTSDNDARLDKLILDQLYNPLLHVVRNAVSHGIERPEVREAAGKPRAGTIRVAAICEANHVVLEISDDGRGLDIEAIRSTAIQRGLMAPDATLEPDALVQFIFQPGFSTAKTVTDISGRGVGLDVVRQEIARLSGSVHVRSIPGQGCTFVIHLPLTLAINQAMFITAGSETCALPLNFVEHIQEGQIQDVTLSGQQELVKTPEGMVPLLRMHRLLDLPPANHEGAVVLARVADQRVAIGVDRILRKQDIVVKPLGPLLRRHPLFSGATLGGDGEVVMIVDLPRLLENESASMASRAPSNGGDLAEEKSSGPVRPTILVVDDSLSVRKVIEKHLHSLHFRVELAVDGLDALEKLRTERISLVLTDLEMPRMHGFELIAEMRRQPSLRKMPVVVVTSRDAEKHRRRATSLGANDYIIKPFSKEQLASHINQLLTPAAQ